MKRLRNLTAILTGATGLLGGAIAQRFAEQGANLALVGRDPAKLIEARSKLLRYGGEVLTFESDITNRQALSVIARSLADHWERVDVLGTVAGGHIPEALVSPDRTFFDIGADALRGVLDLNFLGTIVPCQVFAPLMQASRLSDRVPSASIITISSMSAGPALTNVIGYGASKAAVENATRWLAVTLAGYSRPIRVNAIAPGFLVADTNRSLLTRRDGSLTARGESIVARTPMSRFGRPEEVADAALWLASPESSFVTGVVLPVDGGFLASSGV